MPEPSPRRRRFALAHKLAEGLASEVAALTPEEQNSLRRSLARLTRTNCWWLIYDLRKVLDDLAANQQRLRVHRAKREQSNA